MKDASVTKGASVTKDASVGYRFRLRSLWSTPQDSAAERFALLKKCAAGSSLRFSRDHDTWRCSGCGAAFPSRTKYRSHRRAALRRVELKRLPPCCNPECAVSTLIDEVTLSFGSGVLSDYGFWSEPCGICAAAHLQHNPNASVWPEILPDE